MSVTFYFLSDFDTLTSKFATSLPMAEHDTRKLLAIDNEPRTLELIKDALFDSGLEVLTAEEVGEGLEILQRGRPRIVLLDLMMPGVHGLEMLASILGMDPGTEVILMTADYSAEAAVEAIQKGACDYLSKPLNPGKAPPSHFSTAVGG